MASYTRLIEFKVKDTELTRAVNKLSKTLTSIDKTLIGIDKKLDHIARQGFGGIAKEATKAEKSVSKLGKAVKALSSPQGLARGAVSGAFGLLGGKKGEIARRVAELYAFDGVLRKLTNGSTGLPAFNRRVTEAATALAGFGLAHTGAIAAVVGGSAAILTGTKFFYGLGKGVRQAEANMIDFIKTSRQLGVGKGLRSLFPKGSLWGGDERDTSSMPFAGDKAAAAVDKELGRTFSGQTSPVTGYGAIGSLDTKRKALAQTQQIQEKLVALTGKHLRASVQVRKAMIGYNLELAKTKVVQGFVTADLWAMQKAWQGIVSTIKGAGNLVGGLFGGKFGGVGQAAGVIGLSRGIEALTGKLGFLNKAWIDNTNRIALWSARASEAITAVNIAYTGFSKVLGAAQWTTGAITGFIRWEEQAMLSIRRINRARNNLDKRMAGLLDKGENPLKGFGNWLQGKSGERGVQAQLADKGDSTQQRLAKELDVQQRLLKATNTSSKDYLQIQKQIIKLQKQQTIEVNKRRMMEVRAGKDIREVYKDEIKAFEDRRSAKEKANADSLEKISKREMAFNKKIRESELKAIADKKKARLDAIEKIRQAELKASRDAANLDKRRKEQRGARMGRMGESLMLGAGFPLLFGGGVGSVAGGVTGAALSMGGKGFGAQILLSALGQQVDAFMGQMGKVGQALNSVEKDATPLVERLGVAGSEFERQIKVLEKLGAEEEAFALARERMIGLVGTQGVNDLAQFGKDTQELGNAWKQFMTEMGASLVGLVNAAGILKNLTEGITGKSKLDRGIKNEYNDAKLNDLNWMIKQYSERTGPYEGKVRGTGDLPSLADLQEQVKERQGILDQDKIEEEKEKVRQALNKAALDTLKEEKLLLEDKFRLGDRGAEIEAKIRELKKDNKDFDEAAYRAQAKINDSMEENLSLYREIGQTIEDGLVNAIEGAIQGTRTLGQVASSVLSQIANKMLKLGVNKLLTMIPGVGDFFKADGGPVSGGTPYIVGEKGPELFVPNSSGNIVPNHAMGGSMVVNVDASGSSAEGDDDRSRQLGELIGAAVQSEIIRQQRPGGTLY